jgi:signal transduction histidine kinase
MMRRALARTYARAVLLLDRLRTTRLDAALALAFVVVGLVQTAFLPIASFGLAALFVLGSSAPLAWRRTLPVPAALASAAFWLVPLQGYPVLGFVAVILQFFALGHRGGPDRAVVLTAATASVTGAIGTLLGPEAPVAIVGAVLAVVAPTVAGRIVRRQQQQAQALAELNEELEAQRHLREEAAIGAERARIAQELHDVVGHELTLIAIQAEAAVAALRLRPERAAEPVEAIRSSAHRTLAEVRSVLSLIAPAQESDRTVLRSLVELTDRARSAGIPNGLVVTGTPSPAHGSASLSVARIVRECLTNAGRHAPGQLVTITVDWRPDRVDVRATNPSAGRRRADGRGLTGIRHRAELLGGSFAVAEDDGVFEVRVSLPTTTPATTPTTTVARQAPVQQPPQTGIPG